MVMGAQGNAEGALAGGEGEGTAGGAGAGDDGREGREIVGDGEGPVAINYGTSFACEGGTIQGVGVSALAIRHYLQMRPLVDRDELGTKRAPSSLA
jgi:hypothetical protein